MQSTIRISTSLFLVLLAAVGCNRHESRAPAMAPASRTLSDRDNTIHQISVARCDRDVRCDNIGPKKDYESQTACENDRDRDGQKSLGLDSCKKGIDENRLHECLSAIRAEDCSSPLDSLERVVACRSSALCRD